MRNKTLRILVADEQHFHSMKIERGLNLLGYYRVAPVQSLRDLLQLVDYGDVPIDVLIVNASFGLQDQFDLISLCRYTTQIKHALVYGQDLPKGLSCLATAGRTVRANPTGLPDTASLRALMAEVDPWNRHLRCETASIH
ncbi:response regulator [Pseudomonas chlororaphis subsp. aureofaciens]|uniref:response regulator n=1 Tax=Pseudomonas TaxID=286 RepID=UPI00235FFFA7|nr:response regulator [Pseudomonas sp. SBT1-2]